MTKKLTGRRFNMFANGRGYKIVADCVADQLSPERIMPAGIAFCEPPKPLCFMSRCWQP